MLASSVQIYIQVTHLPVLVDFILCSSFHRARPSISSCISFSSICCSLSLMRPYAAIGTISTPQRKILCRRLSNGPGRYPGIEPCSCPFAAILDIAQMIMILNIAVYHSDVDCQNSRSIASEASPCPTTDLEVVRSGIAQKAQH